LVDTANAILERSARAAAGFVVFRHERHGLVDDEARRRMRLVVPHFRRAALIGKTLGLSEARSATFVEAFDSVSAAMFLVGADGHIVHANTAGSIMLDVADVLRVAAGRIVANDPQANLTLVDVFAAAGEGDMAVGIRGIAVSLKAIDGACYIAHVLPLTSGARRQTVTSYAPVAALLFVHKAALEIPLPPTAMAKAYNLTPMELRVLLAIVEIGGVPEVAAALGVAETTVKTHLGRLYKKTGSSRQADLVKIVGGFSNPLVR
jgi:DNA-binding CsgD family transcriptional regulator